MSELLPVVSDCWNGIGVRGDRSCPKLEVAIHCHNCEVFGRASQTFFDRARTLEYEAELTSIVADVPVEQHVDARSLLLFVVGREAFALDTASFVEVSEDRPVHRVPHRNNRVFAGIVNIHGQLELCVSLSGLLEVDEPSEPVERQLSRMVTVADESQRRWVFRVDTVLGVHSVNTASFSAAPATLTRRSHSFVTRVFEHEQRRIGYLEAKALFAAFDRSVR